MSVLLLAYTALCGRLLPLVSMLLVVLYY